MYQQEVGQAIGVGMVGGRDRHVMEALGMTRVVIEEGRVVEVSQPRLEYCPLFCKYRMIEHITPEVVAENIQFRIEDFGMCTPRRMLRMRDFLSFGISEMMAMCIEEGILDSGVIVCDGAGTVVITDPEVIQGIGGRISGLVETSPIPEIIEGIGGDRVLDAETADIDQVRGVDLAFELGFRKVGVTVTRGAEAASIRRTYGDGVAVFAVHTSGVNAREAELLFDNCDVITACASRALRELGKERSLLTVGSKIPVYAATELGTRIMSRRLERIGSREGAGSKVSDPPRPLI